MREIQRNIHRKTAKYHLLLALTDSIIFIPFFLLWWEHTLSQLTNLSYNASQRPNVNLRAKRNTKHCLERIDTELSVSTDCHQHYQVGDTSLHWTTFNGTFFHRLNFKIQVSNNHLKMVLICTSPFYLHLTYNHSKNDCVNWNIFFWYVSWNDTP